LEIRASEFFRISGNRVSDFLCFRLSSPLLSAYPWPLGGSKPAVKRMDAVLIGGWGVNPKTMRTATALLPPGAKCRVVPPISGCAEDAANSEFAVGWSFGAWRILAAAAGGTVFRGRVLLLAPFMSFCSDFGLGGRCSQAQVLWLHRWLKRDSTAALTDFYMRADLGPLPAGLPYDREDLLRGLEHMAEDASVGLREFVTKGLPEGWRAVVGAKDRLLDGAAICRALPGCNLAPDAGHGLESLVASMKGGNRAF
jgi:hypothetical protein